MKKFLKSLRFLDVLVYRVRHYINYYFKESYGDLSNGELLLFNAIKNDIRNLFDVGARYNTNYLEESKGLNIELYLFEPNPRFFSKLCNRIDKIVHPRLAVKLFNFGFSNEECDLVYYKDTQSFAKKTSDDGIGNRRPKIEDHYYLEILQGAGCRIC